MVYSHAAGKLCYIDGSTDPSARGLDMKNIVYALEDLIVGFCMVDQSNKEDPF